MKTTLRILTVLLALCAVRARADYTISVTTSQPQSAVPGQSGQSYFDFTFSGGGKFTFDGNNFWASDKHNNPLLGEASPFSSLTIDPNSTLLLSGTYASGSTYRLLVDWTVSRTWNVANQYGIYFNLFTLPPTGSLNAGATDIVNISTAAVPEPSQTLAGTVVLGCGLLLGIGRRQFKRLLT